jgi:hypothetical protein
VDPLEEDAFHLVHARKVLEHLPAYKTALQRMVAATRSEGWILVEDADLLSLFHASCSDVSFFARAYRAFIDTMCSSGYQADLGLHLGTHLRDLGLTDVQVRGWTSEWTGSGDQPSAWVLTFEKIRDRVVDQRRLTSDEADRLAEIHQASSHHRSALRSLGPEALTARRPTSNRDSRPGRCIGRAFMALIAS